MSWVCGWSGVLAYEWRRRWGRWNRSRSVSLFVLKKKPDTVATYHHTSTTKHQNQPTDGKQPTNHQKNLQEWQACSNKEVAAGA